MIDLSRRQALALSLAATLAPTLVRAAQADASTVWNLTDLYASDAAWTAEQKAVQADLPKLTAFKGRLGESPAVLREALQTGSDLAKRVGRLSVYASLKADEDLQNAPNQERRALAAALSSQFGEAQAWVDPELLALGPEKIRAALAAEPGLAKFRFYLENLIRLEPHTLDTKGEALLAAAGQPLGGPEQIRSQLVLSDMPWPEIELSSGKLRVDSQGYTIGRNSPVRAERKLVFDTFFGTFKAYESSLGAALAAQVQGDIFKAKARSYASALEASLAPDNIPVAVYRTLVAEAHAGLPVLHRYFRLRARMLGVSDMAYYDIYPPVTKLDRKFDIAESRRLTLEGLKPLGPDYGAQLAKATSSGWAHVYPQKGKYAGAYMAGEAYDVHPYLLLNHTDDYEGMSTYAHEFGHALHTLLASKAQPYETANYPTFTAEIASTLNEILLADYMLKLAKSRDEKLFYLDRLCELFRGTFFRQTMFGEFELAIHETVEKGEALSGEKLTAIYTGILKAYHGDAVAIAPVYGLEWAYPQHFYFNFYVYQYATCVTAATYFAEKIRTGGKRELDAYLGVLKAGGSDYPVDVLKRAGVDMTTPTPYRAIVAKFAGAIDQMEKLLA